MTHVHFIAMSGFNPLCIRHAHTIITSIACTSTLQNLPASIGDLATLKLLRLGDNDLSGPLPVRGPLFDQLAHASIMLFFILNGRF